MWILRKIAFILIKQLLSVGQSLHCSKVQIDEKRKIIHSAWSSESGDLYIWTNKKTTIWGQALI